MAGKKPKKDTTVASAGKESDEEFLKRIMKTKEEATKKAAAEIESYSKSKEVEESKTTGKKIAKNLEEIEECEKIVEEFKINPPIAISKDINGISVEYYYEDKFKSKVEFLKKHCFSFPSATKRTHITSPTFKVLGRAYAKRGGQRILLPESAIPPLDGGMGMGSRLLNPNDKIFVLENGDVIETEKDSYVTLNDSHATVTDSGSTKDKYNCEIFVYPNSEIRLDLRKKESHSEPSFMDPSQVPEAVKRNCSTTVIDYNFVAVSLVKGIFHISILDENKDTNKYLKFASGYPDVEFLHSSKMIENIQDKFMAKMPANVLAMYKAKLPPKSQKICEEISTFIELCDSSIVIFGTANSIKNKSNGKVASPNAPKFVPKDFIIPGKITVISDRIYCDTSDTPDPRARAIMKNKMTVGQYTSLLASKKEYEQKLKELKEKKSKPKVVESEASKREKEKRKIELLEQQKYYKQAGDTMMANATQMQLDEIDPPKETEAAKRANAEYRKELLENLKVAQQARNTLSVDTIQMQIDMLDHPENADAINEEYIKKLLVWCDNEIAKLRFDLNTNFPSYNSPSETDAI